MVPSVSEMPLGGVASGFPDQQHEATYHLKKIRMQQVQNNYVILGEQIVYASRIPPGLSFSGLRVPCPPLFIDLGSLLVSIWVPVGDPGVPMSYIGVFGVHWAPLGGASWPLGRSLGSPWGAKASESVLFYLRNIDVFKKATKIIINIEKYRKY